MNYIMLKGLKRINPIPQVLAQASLYNSPLSIRLQILIFYLPLLPPSSLTSPSITSSQFDIILAKLNDLESVKLQLNTLDSRLNLLQPQNILVGNDPKGTSVLPNETRLPLLQASDNNPHIPFYKT